MKTLERGYMWVIGAQEFKVVQCSNGVYKMVNIETDMYELGR